MAMINSTNARASSDRIPKRCRAQHGVKSSPLDRRPYAPLRCNEHPDGWQLPAAVDIAPVGPSLPDSPRCLRLPIGHAAPRREHPAADTTHARPAAMGPFVHIGEPVAPGTPHRALHRRTDVCIDAARDVAVGLITFGGRDDGRGRHRDDGNQGCTAGFNRRLILGGLSIQGSPEKGGKS